MTTLSNYMRATERLTGQRDQLQQLISEQHQLQKKLQRQQHHLEKARQIIQNIAQQTQQELEYHITELVTLALESVLPDPYRFGLEFELKRGKTDANMFFIKDYKGEEQRIHPMAGSEGGAINIAAFALRVCMWRIRRPRPRATLVLDEPFRDLSADMQAKASTMLSEISHKLGIQMLIVTHEEAIMEAADKVFTVKKRGRVSEVEG